MTRGQLNLALLVVAGALGAAVYFSQEKKEKGPPLTPFAAEAINKIVIENTGAPAIQLEKRGTQWQLTQPVQADADPLEVNNLIALATLTTQSTVDITGARLADLGLDPAPNSVALNGQKLEFGILQPINSQRYVRTQEKVVLVDEPPGNSLDSNYSELVGKALVPDGAEILAIELPGLALNRSADGKGWTLTPDDPKATSDQKQKLADAWKDARAMWNAMETPEGSKGDEVRIKLKDRTLVYIVAEREPQLVLARPDLKVRFTLSKALEPELLQLPAAEAPKPAAQ